MQAALVAAPAHGKNGFSKALQVNAAGGARGKWCGCWSMVRLAKNQLAVRNYNTKRSQTAGVLIYTGFPPRVFRYPATHPGRLSYLGVIIKAEIRVFPWSSFAMEKQKPVHKWLLDYHSVQLPLVVRSRLPGIVSGH